MKPAPHDRIHPDAGWAKRTGKCRYCGKELPKNRSFCASEKSTYCYIEVEKDGIKRKKRVIKKPASGCVHSWCLRTQPGYARKYVFLRDKGKCQMCGFVVSMWHADHIIPVSEGGADMGLDNLRTLCLPCHKEETRQLARCRAFRRKAAAWFRPPA